MIQLLPLREQDVLYDLNKKASCEAGHAYCLYEGGEIEGYLLYDVGAEEAVVRRVFASDSDSFDGLVRAVFSSLLDIQINRVRFSPEVDGALLEKLGFVQAGERVTPSVENILYQCKHCCGGK